jgi:hypothetical protein
VASALQPTSSITPAGGLEQLSLVVERGHPADVAVDEPLDSSGFVFSNANTTANTRNNTSNRQENLAYPSLAASEEASANTQENVSNSGPAAGKTSGDAQENATSFDRAVENSARGNSQTLASRMTLPTMLKRISAVAITIRLRIASDH